MKILYENCQVKDASDTSLPYTSYLVEYVKDGKVQYDVSVGDKKSELFDWSVVTERILNYYLSFTSILDSNRLRNI